MASERQIEANRANAQLSRGPTTDEGKAVSSQNALKHGLTARYGLLPGEDPEAFARFADAMTAQFRAEGALELELAERIASVLWRLRRVAVFEAALIAFTRHRELDGSPDSFQQVAPASDDLVLGQTIMGLLKSDLAGKLARHETHLSRQYSILRKELMELQERRAKAGESGRRLSEHVHKLASRETSLLRQFSKDLEKLRALQPRAEDSETRERSQGEG